MEYTIIKPLKQSEHVDLDALYDIEHDIEYNA